jgi:hypothetical protein
VVAEDRVGRVVADDRERGRSVPGEDRLVADPAQDPGEELADRRLVVHDEDSGGGAGYWGYVRRRGAFVAPRGSGPALGALEDLRDEVAGPGRLGREQVGLLVEVIRQPRIGPDQMAERDDRREPVAKLVGQVARRAGRLVGRGVGLVVLHAGILATGFRHPDRVHGGAP